MTTTHDTVLVGYEVGSGRPVEIPIRHMAVVGMTQESGKTTTLEAIVARSGLRALAFVTKRGETSFTSGPRVLPYFHDRATWQFVDQLLSAVLGEKNKFLRPWIIRICRTTRTLADVQRAVKKALERARGMNEGVYTQLDAYLDLIVPEIGRARLAPSIRLAPGLNVMDVSDYATPMQMLFVQSAIDWVNARERDVVTIIPEAWQFIPEGKGSPVKASAIELVRQGGGLRNFLFADSQDTAGVDKTILRGCTVWLLGVQREANEIKRNLENIPKNIKHPKAADVAMLRRGQFFVCFHEQTVKVYVQPAWMTSEVARAIAMGERGEATMPSILTTHPLPEEDTVNAEQAARLQQDNEDLRLANDRLTRDNADLRRRLVALEDGHEALTKLPQVPAPPAPRRAAAQTPAVATTAPRGPDVLLSVGVDMADEDAFYQRIKTRLVADGAVDPMLLKVLTQCQELSIEVERHVVTADGSGALGWTARLIAEGFFEAVVSPNVAWKELQRRGYTGIAARIYESCLSLTAKGFLTKEADGYKAVPGMKINIVERG